MTPILAHARRGEDTKSRLMKVEHAKGHACAASIEIFLAENRVHRPAPLARKPLPQPIRACHARPGDLLQGSQKTLLPHAARLQPSPRESKHLRGHTCSPQTPTMSARTRHADRRKRRMQQHQHPLETKQRGAPTWIACQLLPQRLQHSAYHGAHLLCHALQGAAPVARAQAAAGHLRAQLRMLFQAPAADEVVCRRLRVPAPGTYQSL